MEDNRKQKEQQFQYFQMQYNHKFNLFDGFQEDCPDYNVFVETMKTLNRKDDSLNLDEQVQVQIIDECIHESKDVDCIDQTDDFDLIYFLELFIKRIDKLTE